MSDLLRRVLKMLDERQYEQLKLLLKVMLTVLPDQNEWANSMANHLLVIEEQLDSTSASDLILAVQVANVCHSIYNYQDEVATHFCQEIAKRDKHLADILKALRQ